MIEVKVEVSELGIELEQVTRMLEHREEANEVAALAVETYWRKHLAEHYLPRDEDGVDFWADVSRSLERDTTATGAEVSAHQLGLRLRYYGGTVFPGKSISSYTGKLTRALAIPSDRVGVTDGRRKPPALSGPLAFVAARGGEVVGYLFEGEVTGTVSRGKNKGKPRVKRSGPLMFTLLLRKTTRPDPKIIPDEDDLGDAVKAALLELLSAE